ncbi:ParM/StbA family protein [Marinobacter gelidimuriae]|jgi:plasmid segregation protein ParM|uniref:ParM/StbA family protein n=1 Tax=Marinobacter gelidimuriae TaxID=2739064 RepID=UPI000374582D|nr:ParM/StbA family protein [Marinobacter gelidimuriae]
MSKKPMRIADDNGYFDHKIAWYEGGKIRTEKYPAILGSRDEAMTNMNGGYCDMYQTGDDQRFVANPDVSKKIPLRNESYGRSPENRVLVNHGLRKAGVEMGQEVFLLTSLPVRDFFMDDGQVNLELVDAQKNNMLQPVYAVKNETDKPERIAHVTQCKVMSEAVAAAFDFLIDETTLEVKTLDAPMAVLDFGGSTFDVVTLTKQLQVRQSSSGTLRRGTFDIIRPFKKHLKQYLDERGMKLHAVPDWMVTQALINREVENTTQGADPQMGSRKLPVDKVINDSAAPIVNEIKAFVKELLPNFSEFQAVLLVGGGSLLCRDLFKDWEEEFNFHIADEYSNARGMLKLATAG